MTKQDRDYGASPSDDRAEGSDVCAGLPADLAAVLRDQSVVVSQDGAVFALIAAWQNAPSNTASAALNPSATGPSPSAERGGEAPHKPEKTR